MNTIPKGIFIIGGLLLVGVVVVAVLLIGSADDTQQETTTNEQTSEESTQNQETTPAGEETSDVSDTDGIPIVTTTVVMGEDSYTPAYLIMKKGSTIIWENESSSDRWPASDVHPSHTIYPEFDPKRPISPGESWSFTFDKVGEWDFHDHIKPSITGNVTITE